MAGTSGTSGAGSVGTLPTIYSSAQQEKYFQLGLTYRSNMKLTLYLEILQAIFNCKNKL